MHSYIHVFTYTYIQRCILTYIHTDVHTRYKELIRIYFFRFFSDGLTGRKILTEHGMNTKMDLGI